MATKQIIYPGPVELTDPNELPALGALMRIQQERIISTEYLRPNARLQAVLDLERARAAYERAAQRALSTMEEVEAQVRDQF